jgi:hypothetical protein
LAESADSVDVVEAALAGAFQGVDIENFVGLAFRSADGELGVIVVRGGAVGADTLNEVETIKADTVEANQSFVEAAGRSFGSGGGSRWNIANNTASFDQDVARNALA